MPTFTDDILINADTPTAGDSVTLAIETVDGKSVTPVKMLFGAVNTGTEVTSSTPLPVIDAGTGGISDAVWPGTGSGSVVSVLKAIWTKLTGVVDVDTGLVQGLTDAQLRATAVPVSTGGLTDAQLRATAVPVSTGGLTDAQLRATAVPVSTGLSQPLTDAQLRAAVVPISIPVARTSVTTTIANGASVSGVIDAGTDGFFGFIAPVAWTPATLSIEASVDNSTWVTTLYDANSIQTGFYSALTASAYYAVDYQSLLSFRYFRLRSGSSASPVNQGADRVFTCIDRPVA